MVYQTEKTRNLILRCAEEVFVEHGFFDAQMQDIATAVGMSRHTLYRYYQNKTDLGMAIAERVMFAHAEHATQRLNELIAQENLSALERFRKFLLEDAIPLFDSPDGRFLAEFDAYFTSHRAPSDFHERFSRNVIILMDPVQELTAQGRSDGSMRADVTPEQVLKVITGLRAIQKEIVLRGDLLLGIETGEISGVSAELANLLVEGMSSHKN